MQNEGDEQFKQNKSKRRHDAMKTSRNVDLVCLCVCVCETGRALNVCLNHEVDTDEITGQGKFQNVQFYLHQNDR